MSVNNLKRTRIWECRVCTFVKFIADSSDGSLKAILPLKTNTARTKINAGLREFWRLPNRTGIAAFEIRFKSWNQLIVTNIFS